MVKHSYNIMRTLIIYELVYNYSDLLLPENAEILKRVIDRFELEVDCTFVYQEAHETVKAFNELFDLAQSHRSWLDADFSKVSNNAYQHDLKGLRLRTFIINNYYLYLYKAKVSYKGKVSRKSRIKKDNSCVLTGMCYDDSILAPIYSFIEKYDVSMAETTFEDLINDGFNNLRTDVESECDFMSSSQYILELIQSNGYEFDENGYRI